MQKSPIFALASIFNAAGQALQDTGRGLCHPGSVLGGINSLLAAGYAVRLAMLAGAGGLGSALLTPGLVLGLTLGIAWYNGRQARLAGPEPRP